MLRDMLRILATLSIAIFLRLLSHFLRLGTERIRLVECTPMVRHKTRNRLQLTGAMF